MNIDKNKIMLYAESLLFHPESDEMEKLVKEFEDILVQMDKVAQLDTSKKTIASSFPVGMDNTYLREDIIIDVEKSENFISNASEKEDGYIVVNKYAK